MAHISNKNLMEYIVFYVTGLLYKFLMSPVAHVGNECGIPTVGVQNQWSVLWEYILGLIFEE